MGNIFRGNTEISALYRGNTPISKAYRGNSLVWEAGGGGLSPYPGAAFIYNAYESSTFVDQSGNGNDGTVTGTANYTVDGIGRYWNFSAARDTNYVSTGYTPTGATSFTLQAVVTHPSNASYGPLMTFDGTNSTTNRNIWRYEVNANRLRQNILIDSSEYEVFYTGWPTPIFDVWYLLTQTYTVGTGAVGQWLNDYNYGNGTKDTTWVANEQVYLHRNQTDRRASFDTWALRASMFFYYPGVVLDQSAIQTNMAYIEQYLDLAPAQ